MSTRGDKAQCKMRACGPKHLGEAVTFCRDWCREGSQEAGTWGERRYSMQPVLKLSLRTERSHTGERSESASGNLGKAVKPEPRLWVPRGAAGVPLPVRR